MCHDPLISPSIGDEDGARQWLDHLVETHGFRLFLHRDDTPLEALSASASQSGVNAKRSLGREAVGREKYGRIYGSERQVVTAACETDYVFTSTNLTIIGREGEGI